MVAWPSTTVRRCGGREAGSTGYTSTATFGPNTVPRRVTAAISVGGSGAVTMTSVLSATARLTGVRWAPLLVMVGAVALGLLGMQIARVGFDLLQPVSVIGEEIAKDPTSPIAVANIVARKNGTTPGATTSLAQLLGLIPVAVMVLVDPRRRPLRATVAYALVLFALMAVRLASLPAFRPIVPEGRATLVALGLTLVAGVVGGWVASRIAATLGPPPRSVTS